eukprot:TRINITY_DN6134_c0_g1_i17.p8 TRINITY_DN6134_c0_g1~~TRINITY_DN6134_c0_g1_i17.p8  ORF type:complete len:102 (+),score=7.14 TRINITY_DN6134_c0_g1_i17:868-1173(+)
MIVGLFNKKNKLGFLILQKSFYVTYYDGEIILQKKKKLQFYKNHFVGFSMMVGLFYKQSVGKHIISLLISKNCFWNLYESQPMMVRIKKKKWKYFEISILT